MIRIKGEGGFTLSSIYAGKHLEDVVRQYSDTLIRVAYQSTKTLADAEDIVQEVFIKLMKYKGDFKSQDHLKAWLIKVTYHRCKDLFRSSWFKRVHVTKDLPEIFAPEDQEVLEEIFLLDKLDRTLVYLYYYEGYKIHEIATMLGKKENTLSSRLQRARKKLKVLIEEGRALNA